MDAEDAQPTCDTHPDSAKAKTTDTRRGADVGEENEAQVEGEDEEEEEERWGEEFDWDADVVKKDPNPKKRRRPAGTATARKSKNEWTDEEDELLREQYTIYEGISSMYEILAEEDLLKVSWACLQAALTRRRSAACETNTLAPVCMSFVMLLWAQAKKRTPAQIRKRVEALGLGAEDPVPDDMQDDTAENDALATSATIDADTEGVADKLQAPTETQEEETPETEDMMAVDMRSVADNSEGAAPESRSDHEEEASQPRKKARRLKKNKKARSKTPTEAPPVASGLSGLVDSDDEL